MYPLYSLSGGVILNGKCVGAGPPPAAVGVGVEDPHAVGQAEPGPGAAGGPGAEAVQGPQHQPLPGLGGRHQGQGLLGVLWGRRVGREGERWVEDREREREMGGG